MASESLCQNRRDRDLKLEEKRKNLLGINQLNSFGTSSVPLELLIATDEDLTLVVPIMMMMISLFDWVLGWIYSEA